MSNQNEFHQVPHNPKNGCLTRHENYSKEGDERKLHAFDKEELNFHSSLLHHTLELPNQGKNVEKNVKAEKTVDICPKWALIVI